jgi:hypothetical protein
MHYEKKHREFMDLQ